MKHVKLKDPSSVAATDKRVSYRFDDMQIGDVIAIVCKKGDRDKVFHSCRTRCKQVSDLGERKFTAFADQTRVYYKRES